MTLIATPQTIFDECESSVRSYSRSLPATFATAKDEVLIGADGSRWVDFLAGAGSLNYGHNPEVIKREVIEYLEGDGLTHGLDMATSAKAEFLTVFRDLILEPRQLDYRVQFCSPSGTNAVEAALKLARLVTGRTNVFCFGGAFHGVSTGSLAATGSSYYKSGLYATLPAMTHIPYPVSPLGSFDSLDLMRRLLEDPSAGVEKPAAVILETVQAEGGVYVAPVEFLRGLRELCDRHAILLIVDDIQAGCGRTGSFFSFERAGIEPDLVTLSKSIGGYGLPMSLLLMRPEHDIWQPGQHNGTFRGNQLAFVAGAAALRNFWPNSAFTEEITAKSRLVDDALTGPVRQGLGVEVRGIGLIWGIDLSTQPAILATKVARRCFDRGLVVETCGRNDDVLKILPPLTISLENLRFGLDTIVAALGAELASASLVDAELEGLS